ncbi:MAG TPA: PHP domain-containing protein [Candidatus Aminicenantes bacterium]|nr:PHP domain-containing protein [Candidatus Aminicenantes bacterium]
MIVKADLHIHTALSPCGSLEMGPTAVVARARELGLDVIAITDHNAVANARAAMLVGERLGVSVLPGLEAQTREDIHVVCLFPSWAACAGYYEQIYPLLPAVPASPDFFGDQVVVDDRDEVVRCEEKLLANALDLPLGDLVEGVRRAGGEVLPAHVEDPGHGLLVTLGWVPQELGAALFEVSRTVAAAPAGNPYLPLLGDRPWITNSDAHYLCDVGRAFTEFSVDGPGLAPLYRAGLERRFRLRFARG